MDLIEFIEYLDEIVDYDKIQNEYNLSYPEIYEHIQLLKDKASQQIDSADLLQCPKCNDNQVDPELIHCEHCGHDFYC